MITKSAEDCLDKYAGFGWKDTINGTINLGKKVLPSMKNNKLDPGPIVRGTSYVAKKAYNGARRGVDAMGRGIEWVADNAVNNPYKVVPVVAAVGLGTRSAFEKYKTNSARIEDPDSGVTKLSPFTGKIKFTDPSFSSYY